MRWLANIRLRVRSLFRRRTVDEELNEELRFHLDRAIEQNIARGMTPEEARRQALIELGGAEQVKEECRDARGIKFLQELLQDMRYGLRLLRKSPGFAITAIVTLALGIGVNVSMLGVVDALLFRLPAHVRAPGELVRVEFGVGNRSQFVDFGTYPQYEQLSQSVHLLDLAAVGPNMKVTLGRGLEARQIHGAYVSHTYFHVLGAHMLLGRAFNAAEDQSSGSPPVVVLGYDLWKKQFDGDPKALGRSVCIAEEQRTIVGVAPKGFTGAGFRTVDLWLPLTAFHTFVPLASIGVTILGRPRGGVSRQAAAAAATNSFRLSSGASNAAIRLQSLFASRWNKLSSEAQISLWIAGVALIVLLIACVNVSSLLLARMAQRRHEMAVRQQLGATRQRLARQVLVECLMIGAVGGIAALLVALLIQPLARSFILPQGFYEGGFLNRQLLGVTAALATLAGCASGLAPAWSTSRLRLLGALKWGEPGHTREGSGLRWLLVVAQLALTLLLAVGAGLFIRSLRKVDAINLGFEPRHLLLASVDLDPAEFKVPEINAAYERMRDRALTVPGVTQVAVSTAAPLSNPFFMLITRTADGKPTRWAEAQYAITPSYFSTMGLRILQGRPLLASDLEGAPSVAVVNESLAREHWPGESPLGKCVAVSMRTLCARVVGVVPDTKNLHLIPSAHGVAGEVYVPLRQAAQQGMVAGAATSLLIRTAGESSFSSTNLFSALESVSPDGRYVDIQPFSKLLDPKTRSWRMGASVFSLFGALALALAAVGIYGVLAFLVRQRTAEIGVRMALGATPRHVLGMVIGEGMKFTAFGVAIGAGAAFGLMRLMNGLLYGVSATDPLTFAAAAAVLALVALLACSLAAWRAMRVDPNVALRYE